MNDSIPRNPDLNRRDFLWRFGGGLGGIAMAHMLGKENLLAASSRPHFKPRAKYVVQLFMNGGASQMDLFDYKPRLFKQAGERFDPGSSDRVEAPTSEPGKILKPWYPLRQHGQSGRWVSDLLPHLAAHVDELAFFMAMTSRTNVHGPASFIMNTGFSIPGFPCLGAWVSYALGRISDNLPTFVVLPDSRGLPYNQKGNFSSGFLPVQHQGTIIQTGQPSPIPHLNPPPASSMAALNATAADDGLKTLGKLNRIHLEANPGDSRLNARIEAYELAARMQLSAPGVFDLSGESETTRRLYGLDKKECADFGTRCLTARRLLEQGVRFVQVWSGAGGPTNNWDNHSSIQKELPPMCAATDQPVAALLKDLSARGMLQDTLVLWSTEFGRMPFSQGSEGRDHNGGTFVSWMAGAGVKPGASHGASDEWSWKAEANPTTSYDYHATVLHLLGLNHEALTFRHNGANRRLTDVHGEVVHSLLA